MLDLISVMYVLPEIILTIAAMTLVILGSILKKKSFYGFFALGALGLSTFLACKSTQTFVFFNGLALASSYVFAGKLVTLITTLCVTIISNWV